MIFVFKTAFNIFNRDILKEFIKKLAQGSSEPINNYLFYKITKLKSEVFKTPETAQLSFENGDIQRMRWIRAGFDALEDKNGIIYGKANEEKEQIVFLTEQSYEILDFVSKSAQIQANKQSFHRKQNINLMYANQQRIMYILRRASAFIHNEILNDKLIKISADVSDMQPLFRQMKNANHIIQANASQDFSDIQIIKGVGKQYTTILFAKFNKETNAENFEIGIFSNKDSSLIQSLEVHSEDFSTIEQFLNYLQDHIDIKSK